MKAKTLYESEILSFTEYTVKKAQLISDLKYYDIVENDLDFLLNITELYNTNIIDSDELSSIKAIILSKNVRIYYDTSTEKDHSNINSNKELNSQIKPSLTTKTSKKSKSTINFKISNQIWRI